MLKITWKKSKWVGLLFAVLLCLSVPLWNATAVEYIFSRGLFRAVHTVLGFAVSWIPFSVTELATVAALPVVVWLSVLSVRKFRRSQNRRLWLRRFAKGTAIALSALWIVYTVMHGANFYRLPTEKLLGYDTSAATGDFLYRICLDLAQKASTEREGLQEDTDGVLCFEQSVSQTLAQAVQGYDVLQQQYSFLRGGARRVKSVRLSRYWSYTGVTGMYFPFFAEANINIDVPACFMPSTAAHELAHTRGFAREDECNFWAYRTCIEHPSAYFRYSGYLLAFVHCSNAYYSYDPKGWEELYHACSDAVLRDLADHERYWKDFEGPVQELSNQVNNAFLTSQGQQSGTLAYGEMVRLVIGYYRTL